jgi:YVTN family beta-propeller protein
VKATIAGIFSHSMIILSASLSLTCNNDEILAPPIDYGAIDTIRYVQHVQPILNKSCAVAGCHDAVTRRAGLELTGWDALIKGSRFGEAVIPHTPAKSLLTMLFDGTALRKPHPPMEHDLTSAEIQFLKRWITEGAKNDSGHVPYRNARHKVYVPNQGEDKVAIIDIDNLVVARYVNVGNFSFLEGPHFVIADQHYWYVSLISVGQIWKFDATTDTLIKIASIPGAPALLALTPDGSKLYVSQFTTSSTNKVYVVNTSTMTVSASISVWTMPHGIRMNHAGTMLYVANMMSDNISVIDVAADSVVATVALADDANPFGPPKYMPMEIAVSPDDSLVAVTCSETREVRLMRTGTNAIIDSIVVGDQPWHLQFTPDGDFCFVSNRRGNSVSAVHIPMGHVMETITSPSPVYFDYPHGCDVSGDGRYVFVSNENVGRGFIPRYTTENVGNVCIIDKNLNQIVKVLEVGVMPTGLSAGGN